jgi:uncharacterized protein involved in type VI secretion and phage assembly
MADNKAWSQKDRLLQVFTDLDPLDDGGDHVLLRSIIGREGLSTPFNYHLQLLSTDHQITAEQMIGTNVTIGIETDPDKHTYRHLNGSAAASIRPIRCATASSASTRRRSCPGFPSCN